MVEDALGGQPDGHELERMVKLSHLRDVIAVAEHGSLRAAARALGSVQPGITRSIREIEHELGITLFERHAKGVRLTDMGRVFLRRAEAVNAQVRRAREEIEQMKGRMTGEVSIALSPASIISVLPTAVSQFRRLYPDAVLNIHESFLPEIERDLISGAIDFYIGPIDPRADTSQLRVEHLFDKSNLIVARRDHPLAGATSLEQLVGAHWIKPSSSAPSSAGDLDVMFERAGLPRPHIVINASSTLISMLTIADSDLLTLVPQQWLDRPMIAGLVVPLDIEPPPAASIAIVQRPDLPLTPVAKRLCELIREIGRGFAAAR